MALSNALKAEFRGKIIIFLHRECEFDHRFPGAAFDISEDDPWAKKHGGWR